VDDAPSFGALLRAAREARGWTMRDLANRLCDASHGLVWKWENETHRPTPRSITRLVDVLGVKEPKRTEWMQHGFIRVPPLRSAPWSESHRRAHYEAVSLRAMGRCRLSDYRLRLGMTAVQFARAADVSASLVCALETGTRAPITPETGEWRWDAVRVADYLGVTCSWLWPEHAPATPRLPREETPTPEELYADAEMREVVRTAVAALPPRERAVIVRRFGLIDDEEATLDEIGPHVGGVSKERVRQLEAQALRELRRALRNAVAREA
jgi:RNA polymerase sigma factor (sigma-70 family)